MLIESEVVGNVEGTIALLGKEVPVKIKTMLKIAGKRMN